MINFKKINVIIASIIYTTENNLTSEIPNIL